MSYEVHITRKTHRWNDRRDPAAITLAEWEAYVAGDAEMQLDNDPDAGAAPTIGAALTEALAAVGHPSRSRWLAYPGSDRLVWFFHQRDGVTVENPTEEILAKMLAVAQALRARVQGDDYAYFDEDDLVSGALPLTAAPAPAATDFRDFQTLASAAAAQPLLAALAQRGIAYRTLLDDGQLAFDPSFANQQRVGGYVVKLHPADFEQARQVQESLNERLLADVPADHYLYQFSDAELFDILTRPDEWSSLDVTLARVLLRQRGRDLSPDTLALMRQRRLIELARPEESYKAWIWLGYLTALLGGAFGVLIGWQLYFHRKTLPSGQRVYAYAAADRVHGLRILVLALLMLVVLVGLRVVGVGSEY